MIIFVLLLRSILCARSWYSDFHGGYDDSMMHVPVVSLPGGAATTMSTMSLDIINELLSCFSLSLIPVLKNNEPQTAGPMTADWDLAYDCFVLKTGCGLLY